MPGLKRVQRTKCGLPVIPPRRYTSAMTLTLDPATERRLQRELARGVYDDPSELIAHAGPLPLYGQENLTGLAGLQEFHRRVELR